MKPPNWLRRAESASERIPRGVQLATGIAVAVVTFLVLSNSPARVGFIVLAVAAVLVALSKWAHRYPPDVD